eukprot:g29440.t1
MKRPKTWAWMRSLTRLRKPTRLPEMMGSIGSIILNENMSIKDELQRNFWTVQRGNFAVWAPANLISYKFIPPRLRVLFANIVAVFWMLFLIWKTSKRRSADCRASHEELVAWPARPSMRVITVHASQRYTAPVKHDDVIIVPEFFCGEDDWDIYYTLIKEMRQSQANGDWKAEWVSWHEGAHLLSQNPSASDTYNEVIDSLCQYFSATDPNRGTRFNWYRDGSDWKPFHHDSAAFNEQRAANQNCTIGISFGSTRDVSVSTAGPPDSASTAGGLGTALDAAVAVAAAVDDANGLGRVLKVEPANREAKQRSEVLKKLTQDDTTGAMPADAEPEVAGPCTLHRLPRLARDTTDPVLVAGPSPSAPSMPQKEQEDDDEDDEGGVDHASTSALISSAAEYMHRARLWADYASALQIYSYARKTCKIWETPMLELKVLSNSSLCLQRLRGRLPELVQACNDTLRRIREIRADGCEDENRQELLLLRMEAASLSRRGSAYAQQRKTEESAEDAARVKELLAEIAELEAKVEAKVEAQVPSVAPVVWFLRPPGCLWRQALRVRLAAAEARLAATQHQEQLREMAPSEEREAQETVNMSPRATVEAPMTPRVREQDRTSPHSPVRNFSLSAELWRLREALAKANGSKDGKNEATNDKVSDLEVQRLRQALASSHAKLQSYEESKEVEPDTARTGLRDERLVAPGSDEEIRPIKPEHLPGSVVKVVPRSPVSFVSRVSPSPIRPIVSPKRTSRKTIEIAMSPPARPVQLSPHPWRGRMTESAPHINREAPSSTPSAPQAPAQSPPRPPALQPNQVMKSTVVPVSGRSPGTPVPSKKLASWTTPRAGTPAVVRVAPPALSTTRSTVQVSPAKATRAGSLSAPPVLLLPETSAGGDRLLCIDGAPFD